MNIIINTDGGSRGNPGPAGIGAVIANESGEVLAEVSEYIGETTNNVAEYTALIRALQTVKKLLGEQARDAEILVRMDSELIVRQMQGIYKVKDPNMKKLFEEVASMRLADALNLVFEHVRREKNARADVLVNAAIDNAA